MAEALEGGALLLQRPQEMICQVCINVCTKILFQPPLCAGSESEEFEGSGKVTCPLSLQTLSGSIPTFFPVCVHSSIV